MYELTHKGHFYKNFLPNHTYLIWKEISMKRRTAIDLNQMYMICDEKTGLPYMDEERCAYLFPDEMTADSFIEIHKETKKASAQFYTEEKLNAKLYKLGFTNVTVYKDGDWENHPIYKEVLPLDYYNNLLAATITLIKKTKKKKYIRELKHCEFLVPVKIKNGDSPEIFYATAEIKNSDEKMQVVFSDIDEFNAWSESMPDWELLKMNYISLRQTLHKRDLLFNPKGNILLLKNHLLPATEEEEE